MAPQNPNPHDELKSLDQQVEMVTDLTGLKPIFFRLEEIARDHPNDFQVQLAVGDIKQHLVNRSARIKQVQDTAPMPAAPAGPPPPPAAPTVILETMPLPAMRQGPPAMPPPPAAPPPPPAAKVSPPAAPPPPPLKASPPPMQAGPPVARPPVPPPPPVVSAPTPPAASPTVILPAGGPPPGPPRTPVPPPPANAGPPTVRMPVQAPPVQPPQKTPIPPAAAASSSGGGWKMPVMIGGIIGVLLALGGIGYVVYHKRTTATATTAAPASGAAVQLAINTNPPGASIRINNETKCNSNCSVTLDPGSYQITAFLDGYEPAASAVTLTAGAAPAPLNLNLDPQMQSARMLTDLPVGKITIDDQPASDLQDGQFVLENLKPGTHVVKLGSRLGEAQFTVEIADGMAPKIVGRVVTKNLFAVMVTSIGTKAHVSTSSGPLKLVANGQPEGDVGPEGVDVKNFQGGVLELQTGDGKDQRTVKENYGPAPTLTAFFKSDQNTGTLTVVTGEDDTRVFVNGKEYPRKTQKGQIRIPTIGSVSVRVMKDGFDPSPQQTAEVKKGADVRMEFKLKPAVIMISLQIRGGTPGAEVLIDQRPSGLIGADGSFNSSVAAGDHSIDIRRDQYTTKHLQRTFRPGQPMTISGADAVLVSERPAAPPPPTEKVTLGTVAPPKPVVQTARAGTMDDWEMPSLWRKEEDTYVHRGAAWIPYKLPAKGTFTFTVQLQKGGNVFRAGKIRWAADYVDAKNYALYEIDNKNFWAKVIENGKTYERTKVPHGIDSKDKSFTIQVEVAPDHVTQRIQRDGQFVVLDNWTEAGRNFSNGQFGFMVQGNDQIGISDFKFQPK